MVLILFSANQSWMERAMSSGSLSLRINSGGPFSSTAPLGEVRYEVPALNVGMRGWPAAASPLKAPGDAQAASAAGFLKQVPLNLFLFTW